MSKVLGIDTSNYTTSVAVVEDFRLIYDKRIMLDVDFGKRGLRQSEALFQHIKNIPLFLKSDEVKNVDAVAVSTKPRPCLNSYMPVFKAGETVAKSIASVMGIPLIETTHQEGHIEAGCFSINFNDMEFIALHISGGTSEVLYCNKYKNKIDLIGGTRDISFGQFLDRIAVAMGYSFPGGRYIDELALNVQNTELVIPSKVDGFNFNLSGQETHAVRFLEKGYPHEEIALAVMKCISKTLDKIFKNLIDKYNKKILVLGGVASSIYLKRYINEKYKGYVYVAKPDFARDNAIGVALIGNRILNN